MSLVILDIILQLTTIIWYLGYEQHQGHNTRFPAEHITDIFLQLESSDEESEYSEFEI